MEPVVEAKVFAVADQRSNRTVDSANDGYQDYVKSLWKTQDGFQNFAARLGVTPPGEGREQNLLSHGHFEFNLVTRNRVELEAAYRGSWIAGKIIDCKAEDMTREGIQIVTNEGAEQLTEFNVQMSRLQIWASVCKTIKWGDLYGGACGVVQIKGQKLDTPLDLDTVGEGQFQGIVVYDRWQLYPVLSELIDSGPEMGLPKYYDIVLGSNLNDPGQQPGGQQTTNANGRVRVHHTRCIRMIGIELPFWQAITEMMWGESVLERLWDKLIEFEDAVASTGNLINRAQLRTIGIDGFREIMAAGGAAQEALIKQFEYMRQFQSSEGLTLMDKDDVFQAVTYAFSGLSDVLLQMAQQLSGSADIPLIRLFSQSPTGMNATGESDLRLYYDGIKARQESKLRNPVEMLIKVLWRSLFGKPVPKDLSFTFTPLWQLSAVDKANVAKTNTDTIIEAHEAGGIDTQTMMKELKQSADETGLFTHITDEQIEEAENEEPPIPGQGGEPGETGAPVIPIGKGKKPGVSGEAPEAPQIPAKKAVGDGAWARFKAWLSRKDRRGVVADTARKDGASMKLTADQQKIKDWLEKSACE
jgi:phage-related protein (TIGR01555 family)